jgi:hypothetical protein
MDVPQLLFGSKRDVLRRAKRFWKGFIAGKAEAGPLLDTSTTPGYLMLNPTQTQGGESDFQLFAVMEVATDDVPPRYLELHALYEYLLRSPWGTLALLTDSLGFMQLDEAQRRVLLGSVVRNWPVYKTLGKRFKPVFVAQPLWDASINLQSLVIRAGVPEREVPRTLPNDDLPSFLEQHHDLFRDLLDGHAH